tara:strand:- start:300 stop:848 length:549 start_codon:yes stop_codon:yes gene_type:complete
MNKDIKFYIPFEGFYNSVYDSIIDAILESEISEGYLTEEQTENINYNNLHLKLSKHIFDCILELFNDEFDLFTHNNYITFDGLNSPKYYNYSTDKIKAIVSPEIYLTLLNKFEDNNVFIDYVNESSKSRSGFTSFYEGINEVKKESSIFLEYLFQWFTLSDFRDEVIEFTTQDIHEIIYNNI